MTAADQGADRIRRLAQEVAEHMTHDRMGRGLEIIAALSQEEIEAVLGEMHRILERTELEQDASRRLDVAAAAEHLRRQDAMLSAFRPATVQGGGGDRNGRGGRLALALSLLVVVVVAAAVWWWFGR